MHWEPVNLLDYDSATTRALWCYSKSAVEGVGGIWEVNY